MANRLDVIVRTLADVFRTESLFRALDSIQGQNGIEARPIVVVNGDSFDVAALSALRQRSGIILHQEQKASAALALIAGHRLVQAPCFSFLDDDDELIAGSLAEPTKWLEEHHDCDVLINNGYFVKKGGARVESSHLAGCSDHPALSLLNECWLSPGASIFRTETFSPEMLSADWNNQEWTRLAFELCAHGKRLHFMDVPTVLYHDTRGSLSKQIRHHEAELDLLQSIRRDRRLDDEVRREAGRKYLRVMHDMAMRCWRQGIYGRAWLYHLASLRPPNTLRYLLSSRKLLWPSRKLPS